MKPISHIQKTPQHVPSGTLQLFDLLFGTPNNSQQDYSHLPAEQTPAGKLALQFNRHALVAWEGNIICILEEIDDCPEDRRTYKLEYQSTPDGKHAHAYCRYNPWDPSRPNAGYGYMKCHCDTNGFICLGERVQKSSLTNSPYTLNYALRMTRYWATAFSYMVEHGTFPQPNRS